MSHKVPKKFPHLTSESSWLHLFEKETAWDSWHGCSRNSLGWRFLYEQMLLHRAGSLRRLMHLIYDPNVLPDLWAVSGHKALSCHRAAWAEPETKSKNSRTISISQHKCDTAGVDKCCVGKACREISVCWKLLDRQGQQGPSYLSWGTHPQLAIAAYFGQKLLLVASSFVQVADMAMGVWKNEKVQHGNKI